MPGGDGGNSPEIVFKPLRNLSNGGVPQNLEFRGSSSYGVAAPPQNPPSVSSSSKKKTVSPKESSQKKAPTKEISAKDQVKAPVKLVQTPLVAPVPQIPTVQKESHVLPLTPRGDHLDVSLIEEMEMENAEIYHQTETPQGQASIIRSIIMALKEQLKIVQRLMDMALEDPRVMPLVAKIYTTTQLNLDLVLEKLL